MNYYLTYHAVERFQERFAYLMKDNSIIKNWTRAQGIDMVKPYFDNLLEQSQENRAFFNDTNYLIRFYEKYGYDKDYKFMEHSNESIFFIFNKERFEKSYRLVTIVEPGRRHSLNKIKYNEKDTWEKKVTRKTLELCEVVEKHTKAMNEFTAKIQQEPINKVLRPKEANPKTLTQLVHEKYHKHEYLKQTENIFKIQVNDKYVLFDHELNILGEEDVINFNFPYAYEEIIQKLRAMIANNQSEIKKKITMAKTLRKATIENKEFHFVYDKSCKEFYFTKIVEPSLDDTPTIVYEKHTQDIDLDECRELTRQLSPEEELYLRKASANKDTILDARTNKIIIHQAQYNGFIYRYMMKKTKTSGYNLFLMKKESVENTEDNCDAMQ